jgi:uncharacterized membrane protein
MFFAFLLSCSAQPVYTDAPVSGEYVVIDIKNLKNGQPQFFTYHYGDKKISFFLVREKGEILSFFDACQKCYPHKLGFRSENSYVVCKYCNERYPLSEIKSGIGTCYPVKLEGRLEGDFYKIPLKRLAEKTGLF